MRQLGPYQIHKLLGKGGMGEVYLAEDLRLGRKVALKLLPPELTSNESLVLRFQQEARTASALNYPNILTIFDIGEIESSHFIATEFVKGETLHHRMAASAMGLQEIFDITIQVASALGAAHEAGVVHRDVKPENIMVRPDGIVKVLDFGIAKLTQRVTSGGQSQMGLLPLINTEPGMVMGTPRYMSPEQVRGFDVDERSDIFSLGAVLYEMITGQVPFEGDTAGDIIASILQKEPRQIAELTEATPAGLQPIIDKALCKAVDARYQTMADLIGDLREQEKEIGVDRRSFFPLSNSHSHPLGTTTEINPRTNQPSQIQRASTAQAGLERLADKIRRHRAGAALVLGLLLAAAVAVIYVLYFASGSKAAINSVAVLPFTNLSNDANMEYLSDGISESLINNLSQLPQLKVIARSSSFKYRDKDLQEAAQALGVQAIVTGRVVQRGDQLQVSVELNDTRDKTQMWGEQFNRKAADLLAVQNEIAHIIAEKLRLRLTGVQEQRLMKRATENLQAYQLYLNGISYAGKGGSENLKKALAYFNQAIALDPNFAVALANVSMVYSALAGDISTAPEGAALKAAAAAQEALKLDETIAVAHTAMAIVKNNQWDWAGAESGFKQALELNPSLSTTHAYYADYLSIMGRDTEALTEIKRARELNPLSIALRVKEGTILLNARRYDEAIQQYESVIELQPDYNQAYEYLGYTYAAKGIYAKAIAEYQKVISSTDGETTNMQAVLGYAYAMSGKRKEALAILNELKTGKKPASPAELAILYAGLGEKDQALASLEKAYAERDLQLQYLKVEPHYDSLRSDPRFTDLMRKVGLTP